MAKTKAKPTEQESATRLKVLRALHSAAAGVYRAQGYRWHEYRYDGYKIGVWKKRTVRGLVRGAKSRKSFVLVPGFGDSSLSWFTCLKILEPLISSIYDEIALLDFPGFSGYLHEEKCFHSMELFLKAGSETLSRLNAHTVLGHSLGGWLTASHAGTAAKKPERIILISPSGVFDSEESKEEWSKIFRKLQKSGDFNDLRPHVFHSEPFWFPLVVNEFSRFTGSHGIRAFMKSVKEENLVDHLLPHITSDVWIIWGEHDTLVPLKMMKGWTSGLPRKVGDKQCVCLKNTGHTPQLESPARLAAVIAKILLKRKP